MSSGCPTVVGHPFCCSILRNECAFTNRISRICENRKVENFFMSSKKLVEKWSMKRFKACGCYMDFLLIALNLKRSLFPSLASKRSPEGHHKRNQASTIARKYLIFSVDQLGLEPRTSRL